MKIEFLYFEGCPSYQTALRNLQQVLEEEKAGIPVAMVLSDISVVGNSLLLRRFDMGKYHHLQTRRGAAIE